MPSTAVPASTARDADAFAATDAAERDAEDRVLAALAAEEWWDRCCDAARRAGRD